jgi:hypothetical protein
MGSTEREGSQNEKPVPFPHWVELQFHSSALAPATIAARTASAGDLIALICNSGIDAIFKLGHPRILRIVLVRQAQT